MKLSQYLADTDQTEAAFAERIGRSREAVRRYCNGERIPDRETMPLIVQASDGRVQPNDFFDLPHETSPPRPFEAVEARAA